MPCVSYLCLLVVGSYAAFYADRAVGTYSESHAAVVQPANESREPTSSGRSLMLESDRQGHFQVEARVEGRFVDFVVDTGASLVVLRETAAAQVGIRLQPRDYPLPSSLLTVRSWPRAPKSNV